MAQELTVVVTGSTGKQGGAVARGLLERGHKVRAVTRDPNSSQTKSLAKARATIVPASLDDKAAITKALEEATSLFAMTTPAGAGGPDAETRQGIAAADAAKAAGVHLVFTSVASADRQTGIPHFDSKGRRRIGVRCCRTRSPREDRRERRPPDRRAHWPSRRIPRHHGRSAARRTDAGGFAGRGREHRRQHPGELRVGSI